MLLREKVRLKLVVRSLIEPGESLDKEKVIFLRSSKNGLSLSDLGELSRYCARHPLLPGNLINWSDLQLL
jgi:hypothetical protein